VSRDSEQTSPEHTAVMRAVQPPEPGPQGACLVVIYGELIGRRLELEHTAIMIGRSAKSDLQLDEDSVSRHHVRIEPVPSAEASDSAARWRVVDLESTNGTYVNDRPVTGAVLRHGDQIQVGRSILRFLADNSLERAYHEELYRLLSRDALTQLRNRRAFDEAAADELGRARRFERPLSLCLLDIDRFKSVNDRYGHLTGDAILRQFGAILRDNVRKNDVPGRLGGEEFGLLLPEVNRSGALVVAEKLRRLVEAHRFEFDRTVIPVTVSIGVGELAPDEADPVALIGRVDANLYRAKNEGRNRVVG
jgi:two-component system cell cycle response regulator